MLIQQNSVQKSPTKKLACTAFAVYLTKLASIEEKIGSTVVSLLLRFPHYKKKLKELTVSKSPFMKRKSSSVADVLTTTLCYHFLNICICFRLLSGNP